MYRDSNGVCNQIEGPAGSSYNDVCVDNNPAYATGEHLGGGE